MTIFGCSHRNTQFPFTSKGGKYAFVRCLNCGARRDFDWKEFQAFGPWYTEMPDTTKPEPGVLMPGIERHALEEVQELRRMWGSKGG